MSVNPQAIKLHSFRETTCQSCSLRSLCLPLSLNFQDIDRLDSIINRGHALKKGDFLFRQGDKFGSLYALRSGCIKTYTLSDSGEEQITGFYMPGELIGLSGIDSEHYPVSAIAIETTSICEIPYPHFDGLMDEIPGLKRQLIHSLSKEIREDLHMKLLLSQKNADERVANFLLDMSSRIKRRGYAADFIYLSMSRNEIANYLGLAVETVSRVFTRLQKSGLLSANGRSVEIHSPEELTKLSGQCVFSDAKDES